MIAADTNNILRIVLNDNAKQTAQVLKLVKGDGLLLLDAVLLEAAWVLESFYQATREQVFQAMQGILGTQGIEPEGPAIYQALDWYRDGMDFEDAVILAAAVRNGCSDLSTFDKHFIAKARGKTDCRVRLPG